MKTQNELKNIYFQELENESTWKGSKGMIDYCKKNVCYFIELHDGGIMAIDKPKIQTSFCFGYSDSPYDTEDYDRANGAMHYANTHEDYFIRENLEDINRTIENLKDALESENLWDKRCRNYYILKHHWSGDSEKCKIRSFEILDRYEEEIEKMRLGDVNGIEIMNKEDIENRLEGLEAVKAQFTKRLTTYLKRYGLSKLHTWTYWRDE